MDVNTDLILSLLVILLEFTDGLSDVKRCAHRNVKASLKECNPLLAEISTIILHTPLGANYSQVCR